jgi:hypothetical protein
MCKISDRLRLNRREEVKKRKERLAVKVKPLAFETVTIGKNSYYLQQKKCTWVMAC